MKILVCISHVPDTTSKINFTADKTAFDSNGIQFVINPNDEFGLTKAVQLKEANGGTVTVAHVGNATTEPTLRKALAIGADEAIRIDAEATDSFQVAQELASLCKANSYDLIICGKESLDYNGSAVHSMLATLLEIPVVNACIGLTLDGTKATVIREIEGGKETIETSLPLVLGGQKGLVEESELRIPNMRGIMSARSKPLQVVEASADAPKTTHSSFEKPAPKADCKLIEPGNENELVELLHQEAKVI